MSDFFHTPLNPLTGEDNATALLICRGTGICDLDFNKPEVVMKWKDVELCEKHAKELLLNWEDSSSYLHKHVYRRTIKAVKQIACSIPESVLGVPYPSRSVVLHHTLTIQEADLIMKQKGILVHPGIPLCHTHKQFLEELKNSAPADVRSKPTVNYADADIDMDLCDDDPLYVPSETATVSPAASHLQQFALAVGVGLSCSSRKSYSDLKDRCKQNKAVAIRKLINVMIDVIAPQDKNDLESRIFKNKFSSTKAEGSEENFNELMNLISSYYQTSFDRKSKLTVLSLVADVLPFSTVEKFIPGLSRYLYGEARKFSRRNRDSEMPEEKPKIKENYNRKAVESFIGFITSPDVMIGLPFGVKKVKLSDGSKVEIPNTIRQQSSSEIFEMYNNLMEAFDGLHSIIDSWIENGVIDLEVSKELKTELYEAAQYLRTDFRLHVKKFSRVADHCATYALSDPINDKMALSCTDGAHRHDHDYTCQRCERVDAVLSQTKSYAELLLKEAEGVDTTDVDMELKKKQLVSDYQEHVALIDKYTDHVYEMKKHLLRASVANQERESIISSLEDNEVLITIDFAQKFLPKWHREKQSDYFGKKGLSYHVSHITARIGEKYAQHSFVHIYDGEVQQNSELVVLTLSHIVQELKKVGITAVSFRSDNAGAYHCASTIASLHWLMEEFGVAVKSYSFSEAQNGKSSSDRDAARVKQKAARYVASGNDITTSKQFFEAIKSGKPLNGVSVYHGSVTPDIDADATWPGISSLNYFTVEEGGIRGHKYFGLGEGVFVSKDKLQSLNGTFEFEGAGFLASGIVSIDVERDAVRNGQETKFWYYSPRKCENSACTEQAEQASTDPEEPSDVPVNPKAIFSCPEPGCSASYLRHSNLEKHTLRGVHNFLPEKMTMLDYSLDLFARGLENINQIRSSVLNSVADTLSNLMEATEETVLQLGWALPKKQSRKPYPEDVKKFLIECFEEGLKKKKLNPVTIGKMMAEAKKADGTKRFSVEQRMDVKQIAGFLSREARKRRTGNARVKRDENDNQTAPVEDNEYDGPPDGTHPDADWIEFMDEVQFWTEWDEFLTAIYEHPDPIFNYEQ
ncbi:hypothetical protein CAEBREN_09129 [Caenorhabditis brenneri]|uniref:C2H2-type domain-containing protein n=1 Tax=Caenorhabditis brenneri TaxID=135651 RepID=G0NYT7_CAEBE|nr:hypothetical protein CAEBREN_09129 [Caenorhabditis brenneri]